MEIYYILFCWCDSYSSRICSDFSRFTTRILNTFYEIFTIYFEHCTSFEFYFRSSWKLHFSRWTKCYEYADSMWCWYEMNRYSRKFKWPRLSERSYNSYCTSNDQSLSSSRSRCTRLVRYTVYSCLRWRWATQTCEIHHNLCYYRSYTSYGSIPTRRYLYKFYL